VRDGFAAPSTTVLDGRVVLRLCTINPRTTHEDVEATIERMESFG
jgi:aromatic-L-amino-acid/L-tryptophan decarboxylase